jgi:hypothetical protein
MFPAEPQYFFYRSIPPHPIPNNPHPPSPHSSPLLSPFRLLLSSIAGSTAVPSSTSYSCSWIQDSESHGTDSLVPIDHASLSVCIRFHPPTISEPRQTVQSTISPFPLQPLAILLTPFVFVALSTCNPISFCRPNTAATRRSDLVVECRAPAARQLRPYLRLCQHFPPASICLSSMTVA